MYAKALLFMCWLSVVKIMLQLNCFDQIIHVQKVTADLFCNIISIDCLALLLSRQEFFYELDFIDRKSTLECLVDLCCF